MGEYSFGDSDLASRRLALVARVFEPPSRRFLEESGPAGCGLAVDVGCGPGFTTRLVHGALGCGRTVGLDASERFLEIAARDAAPGTDFLRHDALDVPWPTGPADCVYARLLLSHLSDPARAIRGFASQLRPGGRLLLDEVEWIRSEEAAFQRYLEIVEQVLEARGQRLQVGPRLEGLAEGLRVVGSDVRVHAVDPRDAAAIFCLNLQQLRHDESVANRIPRRDLDELAADLGAIRADGGAPITWGLRQLAVEA